MVLNAQFETNNTPLEQIEVFKKLNQKINGDDLFFDIKAVSLELNAEALIGDCSRLEFYKGVYYVLDGRPSNFFMFDERGKYISRFGKKGDGPGEYRNIRDFEIDKVNNEVIVYSPSNLSLLYYNLSGEFLRKVKLEFFGDGFEIIDESRLVFYSNYNPSDESGRYNVLVSDRTGKILKKMAPFPATVDRAIGSSGFVKSIDGKIYYNNAFADTLWVLNENFELDHVLHFDFQGNQWKNGFDFRKSASAIDHNYLGKRINGDEDFLLFSLFDKRKYRSVIYSRQDKAIYNEDSFKNPFLFKLLGTPGAKADGLTYLSSINAQSLGWLIYPAKDEWEDFQKQYPALGNELNQMLEEEGNPVIIQYKIKRRSR